MAIYHLPRKVIRTHGTQTFAVEAESKEEAFKKFKAGEGDMIDEEIEVISLGEFSIKDVTER